MAGSQSDLEQLLLNLLTNGRDAVTEGGSVSLHARRSDDAVEVVITDTGCRPLTRSPKFTL